ncbi:MAG: DAK2 domain-containing protein [Lachnospiraceae bacterium]|nr:DAK2 domain-containing protein [Lachnospiraceae bacterium]
MSLQQIDAKMLSKMFLAGAKNLENKKEWINELNVFPVPDVDTGTNMTMTIMSAAKDVAALPEDSDMDAICKAISSGSLRGARGNSGVILSQLFRGFTKVVKLQTVLDIPVIADSFDKAVETAYKAVMKPKEGTILTVAKGAAECARELADEGCDDMETFFRAIIEKAEYVLSQTPEMLPVLKQAGVVDSGGQGLVEVLHGAFDAFMGKEIDFDVTSEPAGEASAPKKMSYKAQADADIKFGYCTEFIILLNKPLNVKTEKDFKGFLESIGDSIVCVSDEEMVKVHVHTNDPGLALQKALKYGALSNMKIDNMRMEHREKLFRMISSGKYEEIRDIDVTGAAEPLSKEPFANYDASGRPVEAAKEAPTEELSRKEAGFIAVSVGDGVNEIFRSLGVDYIIEGGQTMNPSTADILDAVEHVNADTIFVLPNNSNIILAANQAAAMMKDKKLCVVPTKTVPQGITAVINYVTDLSPEENLASMQEEIKKVKTGQVTYAVRDTVIDNKEIKKDDYMGIGDAGIISVGTDMRQVTEEMVAAMVDEDSELISIYYGSDIEEAAAEELKNALEAQYASCDIELQFGGQPIYYYLISVE